LKLLFKVALTVFLVSLSAFCNAGELRLRYSKYPLSDLLVIIRDETSLSLSFNQGELSRYKITVDSTFADGLSAIRFLVKEFPLNVNIVNGVIVISPKTDANILSAALFPIKRAVRDCLLRISYLTIGFIFLMKMDISGSPQSIVRG